MNDTDDTAENDVMNVFAVYQHAHLLGSKIKYVLYRFLPVFLITDTY